MRIAIAAEPFGFGPASKAFAITQALLQADVEVVPLLDSVAYDYFMVNKFSTNLRPWPARKLDQSIHRNIGLVDAAIVCLDPLWLSILVETVPTYFVDSLGFMWDPDFMANPALRKVKKYFVQDIFEATSRVTSFLPDVDVQAVGAIVDVSRVNVASSLQRSANDGILSLGGFHTEAAAFDRRPYWQLIRLLIEPTEWTILTSQRAAGQISTGRHLSHTESLRLMVSAKKVAISPGLTTLLEAAAVGIPIAPLPPQNYSQALIIRRLAALGAGESWDYLMTQFNIKEGLTEAEGVSEVQCRLVDYAQDTRFGDGNAEISFWLLRLQAGPSAAMRKLQWGL
jgi:hypothetical protein